MEKATSHYDAKLLPGSIRLSPLMYGSLRYIATRHSDGTLSIDELSALKQTQLRSFKGHEWIMETNNGTRVGITREGRRILRIYENNDDFFRRVAYLSFTSLLNLNIPDEEPATPAKKGPVSVERKNATKAHKKSRAA